MTALSYTDHRSDPGAWARSLAISRAAVDLYLDSDVIDLHVDSFIWRRVFGYDLAARHGRGLFGGRFYSQVDFPRAREAQISGAIWAVTTNPLVSEAERPGVFGTNLAAIAAEFARAPEDFALVTNEPEYRAARAAGKHGAFVGIQGGNALDASLDAIDALPPGLVVQVTLVHLSSSKIGVTSSPLAGGGDEGLSAFGRAFVERLDEKKIFVDLAHVGRKGFYDALEAHDPSRPVLVTHTGVAGVTPHWRNLDDEQLRAVARTGGVVGVIYHSAFVGDRLFAGRLDSIVDHLAHVANVAGDDAPALGSDWDGMIDTPRDMPTCLELPRIVQKMLDRGWSEARVRKALGANFLRALRDLRGGAG